MYVLHDIDHPEAYGGLPKDPRIPLLVRIWKGPLKWLGNLAMVGGIVGVAIHYLRFGPKSRRRRRSDRTVHLHERICHWVTGFTYLYCLATGLAFYSPYLFWMAIVLGGGPTSRFWHPVPRPRASSPPPSGCIGIWRTRRAIAARRINEWLDKSEILRRPIRTTRFPPQGRFNAGQKVYYWAMFYGALLLLLSGVFMWFPEYVPFSLRWIRPIVIVLSMKARR